MVSTFKKLVKLNWDDLLLFGCVEGGLFLLVQIVIGCVMYFGRPGTSVNVAAVLFPVVAGFTAFAVCIGHAGVSFDLALRFGQTRKRALGLMLGLMSLETAFGLALSGLLAAAERFLCVPLWAKLAGMNGWVLGQSGTITPAAPPPHLEGIEVPTGSFFENMAGELVPVPEKTLIIETFTLDWYWWLLIFAAAIMGGVLIGALIQRFGSKGLWIVWAFFMALMLLPQSVPAYAVSQRHTLLGAIPILGAVLLAAGFAWSVWSLLHATVRS